ncbi:hypothetical protein Btru_068104, partial [Bulinus truncatus]
METWVGDLHKDHVESAVAMETWDVRDEDEKTRESPTSDLPDYVGDGPDLAKQVDISLPVNNEDGCHKQDATDAANPKEDSKSRDSVDLNLPPREHWENRFQFLLSTIGYAVDLSNVWRFPFLCYKNGGGAFLIPYFTTLIFGAMPVFFMEMCLGQFNRCGPTAVWDKMAPMFKGIGIASCFMAYIVAFYYNVIIGWSFFYLFASFTSILPWTTCFNPFNSDHCWQIDWDTNATNASVQPSMAADDQPLERDTRPANRTYNVSVSVSSTMEYFERGMLELHHSTGLEDLGVVRWQLALCTFLTFTVLYFCLWKGVKSTGKVVYITATLPYVIMTILLVRGVLLPGAEDGIRYFITPKIDSLRKPKVWIDAAVQIFFSVGSGFGTHIAYSSYNKFHNDLSHYTASHYRVSHCTVPHYTVPQYSISHYTVPHYTESHYTVSHCTVPHYTVPQYSISHYTVPHYTESHYTVSHYTVTHYSVSLYTVPHYTVPHYSVPHYTLPQYSTSHYKYLTAQYLTTQYLNTVYLTIQYLTTQNLTTQYLTTQYLTTQYLTTQYLTIQDCIVTVIVNSFTSLFSGFVIFSYLGYMALRTHKDIDKVATEGPGLVFIVYPEAIATLPGSVGWSIIFFFMLLSLGLDSAFGGLESPLTGIRDELSQLMKYRYFREVLTLIIILSAFLFSIPCLMQ